MGGGLVLFGIGGDVSGGLVDAFKGGGGGSSTDSALEDRVDSQEERLAKNPQNEAVLKEPDPRLLPLATSQRESGDRTPDDAKDDLRKPASTGSATGSWRGAECRGRPLRPQVLTCRRSTARRRRRRRRRSSRRTRTTWPHTFGWSRTRRSRATPERPILLQRRPLTWRRRLSASRSRRAEALKSPTATASGRLTYPSEPPNFHIEDEP